MEQNLKYSITQKLIPWLLICLGVGFFVGSSSALFLLLLEYVTLLQIEYQNLIFGLPIAGIIIGFLYAYWGKEAVKGNNLLIEEFQVPKKRIPFVMAPLVFTGTIITHLFGGSAGREGTAVQIGGTIADKLYYTYFENKLNRKIVMQCGIGAGFASVFGTPWAGLIFAYEMVQSKKSKLWNVLPITLSVFSSYYTCNLYPIHHSHYFIKELTNFNFISWIWLIVAGIVFGITAFTFVSFTKIISTISKKIRWEIMRPFFGAILLITIYLFLGNEKSRYVGLGVPILESSFSQPVQSFDFLLKLIVTSITLGFGFKGGEVTPLFFIGATLGNLLSLLIPLPLSFLTGMGFIAVFSGASNAPLTAALVGCELFGFSFAPFVITVSYVSYFFSGNSGVYASQKHNKYSFLKKSLLS